MFYTRRLSVLFLLASIACNGDDDTDIDPGTEVVANQAPTVGAIPEQNATASEAFAFDAAAFVFDDEGPSRDLTYTVTSGDGSFTGSVFNATFSASGTESVAFTVADSEGLTADGAFDVAVADAVEPETLPTAVMAPDPTNGADDVTLDTPLSWSGGEGATTFQVYLSTSLLDLASADASSAAYVGEVTDAFVAPTTPLTTDTSYFWRVDATNEFGTTAGPTWTFTTEPLNHVPDFTGLRDAAALGLDGIHLSWNAATDAEDASADLVYVVYGGELGGEMSALFTTDPGATSAIVTSTELAAYAADAELQFTVHALDSFGDEDDNQVIIPVVVGGADASIVYVDDDALDLGLGSLASPFATVTDAIDALAVTGGVIVLADGVYPAGYDVTETVAITFMGGFPDLSTTAATDAASLLTERDIDAFAVVIDGSLGGVGISIDNGRTPTQLSGITFLDFDDAGVLGNETDLIITGSTFARSDTSASGDGIQVDGEAEPSSLRVYGSAFSFLSGALSSLGTVDHVDVRGNDFFNINGDVIANVDIWEASGEETSFAFVGNTAFTVDSLIDELSMQPSTETAARITITDNQAQHVDDTVFTIADVGETQGTVIDVSNNYMTGIGEDCLELDFGSPDLIVGDVDLQVVGNTCGHTNDGAFEISDIAAPEGLRTNITLLDNLFFHHESGSVELDWNSSDTNVGIIDVEYARNQLFQDDDSTGFSIDGGDSLTTYLRVWGNEFLATEGSSIELQVDCELCEVSAWVAWNDLTGSAESEQVIVETARSTWVSLNNNLIGSNDVDSSAAVDLNTSTSGGGHLMIANNIIAQGAGSGIELTANSVPEIINNTITDNGRDNSSVAGVEPSSSSTASQVLVQNSIVYGNAVTDLGSFDEDDVRVSSTYSLLGRGAVLGFGDLSADPQFLNGSSTLDFLSFYATAATSPVVDAGNPADVFGDVDGTRNDIGAFGGPNGGALGALGANAVRPMEVMGLHPLTSLQQNARMPSGNTPLEIVFTGEVDEATATSGITITVDGVDVAGTTTFDGRTATFAPSADWPAGSDVTVDVVAVEDIDGTVQQGAFTWTFGTAADAPVSDELGNDTILTAQVLTGSHLAAEGAVSNLTDAVDVYAITATAGQRLSTSLFARRLDTSTVALTIELRDSDDALLKESAQIFRWDEGNTGRDAYLDHMFETSGTFYLVVGTTNDEESAYELEGWIR